MSRIRHWKQTWDFDADLVFRKRMILNVCGVGTVEPGDPVTDELKKHFGPHRLRIWWDGNFLAIDDKPERSVVAIGGGYYDVTINGETTRVRGKANIPS